MGWSLTGLSAIVRTGNDYFHDGAPSPVAFTYNDKFELDGVRLIATSGAYGYPTTTYATESDNFAVITSNGTNGNGPDWFQVTLKDGTIMEYGKTSDSKFPEYGSSPNAVYQWLLDRIQDINGNYISFTYSQGNTLVLLTEIDYTGNVNTGLQPYNTIKFNYSIREDDNTVYDANLSLWQPFLLDNIVITGENSLAFKTYSFNYGFDNIRSYLQQVTEYGANGHQLNNTIFKYGENAITNYQIDSSALDVAIAATNINSSANNASIVHQAYSGDFNGDGVSDIMISDEIIQANGISFTQGYSIYTRDITTGQYTQIYQNIIPQNANTGTTVRNAHRFIPKINFKKPTTNSDITSSDFNGDGLDDIISVNLSQANNNVSILDSVNIGYSNMSNGYSVTPYSCALPPGGYNQVATSNFFYTGDFDGDGITDYILFLGNGSGAKAFISFPGKNVWNQELIVNLFPPFSFPPPLPLTLTDLLSATDKSYVIDFDGDGKSDILFINTNMSNILTINYNSITNTYSTNSLYSGSPTSNDSVYVGDFNGDGKTDLLTISAVPVVTFPFITLTFVPSIAYSTGTDFNWQSFTLTPAFNPSLSCSFGSFPNTTTLSGPGDEIYIGDYDGDGKCDILHYSKQIANCSAQTFNSQFNIYYSTGNNEFYEKSYNYPNSEIMSILPAIRVVADMDGDGKSDITYKEAGSDSLRTVFFDNSSNEKIIEKIEDGLDRVTQFNYSPLTQNNIHTQGAITPYPLNSVQFPLYVVSTLTVPNPNNGQNTTNYLYQNAQFHKGGRGFLGFIRTDAQDNTFSKDNYTQYSVDPTFYVPYISASGIADLSNTSNLYAETDYSDSFISEGNGLFWVKNYSTFKNDYVSGAFSVLVNIFDAFGNITEAINNINNTQGTTTYTSFGTFGTPVPASPTQIVVISTGNGPTACGTHNYTYSNNLLSQDSYLPGAPLYSSSAQTETDYSYDAYGNITQKTLSGFGTPAVSPQVTINAYDTKGRFPISSTNPLSQVATATYDPLWGKPQITTGIDGLNTYYYYDEWGKLVQTYVPQGYYINTSYNWDFNFNNTGSYWNVTTLCPGKPTNETWYNQLGQEVMSQSTGLNGLLTTTKTYDNLGNIVQKTAPYLPNETPMLTSYSFDYLNRLSTTTNFQGITNYSYSNNNNSGNITVTVSDPATYPSSKTTDPTGKVIETTDNGGTLDFTYDNWGNKLTVSHSGLNIITNQYDFCGRLSNSWQTNRGTITYAYDPFSRMVSETDANNNQHQYTYDVEGKTLTRTGPEGTTSYQYYSGVVANGYPNALQQITNFDGRVNVYSYDGYGNLIDDKETAPGSTFQTDKYYVYDLYGNMTINDNTFAPNNASLSTGYSYDNYGHLTEVYDYSNSNTVYFQANAQNGLGQYTQYTLGNGVQTNVSYTNGLPTHYQATGATAIQDLQLSWDNPTLTLSHRSDNIKNITDFFQYDNLNRLTQSATQYPNNTPNTPYAIDLTYDEYNNVSRGNIYSKTDAGAWYQPGNTNVTHQTNSIWTALGNVNFTASSAISHNEQDISYTGFSQADSVKENGYLETFTYDANYQRATSKLYNSGTLTQTTEYYGQWEHINTANGDLYINYINGGDGICAIVVTDLTTTNTYYVYKDHLGSFLTLTDQNGTVVAEQNFDAWGRSRNPTDWTYNSIPTAPNWLIRGFTGQEQMPQFALVNLNARLYDPTIGRMLGVDKYVSDPSFTQDYNSYTYARNNPLSYTDKTGNFIFTVLCILTGQLELLPFAIAADAGGITNLIGNSGKIGSIAEAGAYYLSGAAGGATAMVNPIAGGAITATGNTIIDALNGHLPDPVTHPAEFLDDISGNVLSGMGVTAAPGMANGLIETFGWTQVGTGGGASFFTGFTGNADIPVAASMPDVVITDAKTTFFNFGDATIGATGKLGEDYLKTLGGKSQVYFNTSMGGRYVDQLVDGVANESKVGYTSLTKNINQQILKDAELMQNQDIQGATWHFFQSPVTGLGGPSQPLYNMLQQYGIDVIIH